MFTGKCESQFPILHISQSPPPPPPPFPSPPSAASPPAHRHRPKSVLGSFNFGFRISNRRLGLVHSRKQRSLIRSENMSAVNLTNVAVLDNPAAFLSPFQFEISYECLTPLKDDLEWKLIYVGSAEDETYDQMLESVLVGPVNVGNYRFVLQADPPDPSKIREEDIIGVTVLLLTCSYLGQEFVRVGYYVNNDYDDEQLREEPPSKVLVDRVQRNILADKPRVTKFPINFHPENSENAEQQPLPSPDCAAGENIKGEEPPISPVPSVRVQ